uniref:Endonuclease/exonuclease/phosphatase domain-containing protein n=1 Tax=Acrobeloides nanus TaxID=290746 RepID=A0A914DLJ7_9BILA
MHRTASVKIRLAKQIIHVASIYRPPSKNLDKISIFHEQLTDFLSGMDLKASSLLMAGDVNICWYESESEQLKSMATEMGLAQDINEPTHNKQTIDHFY